MTRSPAEIKRLFPDAYKLFIEKPWETPGYAFFLAQKAKLKQKAKEKTPM